MFFGLREACSDADDMKRLGLSPGLDGKRVVVQGFGNVGYHSAKFCQEGGAIVVAVSERDGTIYREGGLDVEAVQTHLLEKGSIRGFPGARDLPTAEGLELECDVLIPAALEGQITVENAPRIRARIIAEGANGPTTFDAERILLERGIMVIPDIYLNAGRGHRLLLRVGQEPLPRPVRARRKALRGGSVRARGPRHREGHRAASSPRRSTGGSLTGRTRSTS